MTRLATARDFLDAERRFAPRLPGLDDDAMTRAFVAAALFVGAFFVLTVPAWLTDPRTIDGASVWLKPQKFNVSLAVQFLTLAYLAQLLPRRVRTGPALAGFGYAAIAAMLFEQCYITIQAARARRSHFNYETGLEAQLYMLMGLGALLLVAVGIVLGIQIWRKGDRSRPGLRLGAIIGLIVGGASTLVFAGYMSSGSGHWVGTPAPGDPRVPFFGWSLTVGDLRPAHFVSLHLMQTLPLVGWVVDRLGRQATLPVFGACALQLGLAIVLFVTAVNGQPLWPF